MSVSDPVLRTVSPAGVENAAAAISAPDDHLAAGPDCCLIVSTLGRASSVGSSPSIGAGIVSSSIVEKVVNGLVISAPDNHFTAGPDCRVKTRAIGRVGDAGRCPTVSLWIISPAGVKADHVTVNSAPDDHFTASPHGGVIPRPAGTLVRLVAVQLSVLGIVSPAGVQIGAAVQGLRPR